MSNLVILGPEYYPKSDKGSPVSGGSLYVGNTDTDPEIVSNQKQVQALQENGSFVNITQPVSLSGGGIPLYNGSPVSLYVSGDYSLKVLDINGSQVYYVPLIINKELLSPGNYYYPDYTESDQGVVGDGETVKAILDDIGSTNKATIYFKHNSGNEFTDYLFSTSTIIPSNVSIIMEVGARLKDDTSNADLTINGSLEAELYQIFDWVNGSGVITFGSTAFSIDSLRVVYPQWWGGNSITDGTINSSPALHIQAAIDSIGSSGGTVFFPSGTYNLEQLWVDGGGNNLGSIAVINDNVTLKGEPGSKIFSTVSNSRVLSIIGNAKVADISEWEDNEYQDQTMYGINEAQRGDSTVTTSTAGHAANFSVGDIVWIRTGQTLPGDEPQTADSELNEVVIVDDGTGIITLRWPLSKPYLQENYEVGSSGVTAVGGAGSAAPLGIHNVNSITTKNCVIENLEFEMTTGLQILSVRQVLGLKIANCKIATCRHGLGAIYWRLGWFLNNECYHDTQGSDGDYWFGPSAGSGDIVATGNNFSSNKASSVIHLHEGTYNILFHSNKLFNTLGGSTGSTISIRARSYSTSIQNNVIVNGPQGAAIIIAGLNTGEESGYDGIICNNIFVVDPDSSNVVSIRVYQASGWIIRNNKVFGDAPHHIEDGNYTDELHEIWVPASEFIIITGTPVYSPAGNGKWESWLLDDGTTEAVSATVRIPAHWVTFEGLAHWTNDNVNAGDVTWSIFGTNVVDGEDLDWSSPDISPVTDVTAPAEDILKVSILITANVSEGLTTGQLNLTVRRLGGDGDDTLVGDAAFLGILLKAVKTQQ